MSEPTMPSAHTTSASKALPRRLGLIFPPAGRGVPEEGLAMYGDRIEYLVETLGLKTMTPLVSSAPQADALLISCGGLRTLEILAPLEARTKIPAVSSTPHALLVGARLVGLDGKVPGYGALFSR